VNFVPVVFEDFFTNERDKGFLLHVRIAGASGSQSGDLFAYPSANLLVMFGFHSFSLVHVLKRGGSIPGLPVLMEPRIALKAFSFVDSSESPRVKRGPWLPLEIDAVVRKTVLYRNAWPKNQLSKSLAKQ
jgi:hypothetical protein